MASSNKSVDSAANRTDSQSPDRPRGGVESEPPGAPIFDFSRPPADTSSGGMPGFGERRYKDPLRWGMI